MRLCVVEYEQNILCTNCYVLFQLVDRFSHIELVKKAYLYYTSPDRNGVRTLQAAGSGSVFQIRIQIQSQVLK